MALIREQIFRISTNTCCLVLLFLFITGLCFSQEKPVLFSSEIGAIEKKLADPKLAPAERKKALETKARLLELSGNAEGAADAWKAAALVGTGDLQNLLHSARCLAAMGEFENAQTTLQTVMKSSDRILLIQARFLNARIEALRTGNVEALNTLLNNPDFQAHKAQLYYSIWRISADTSVKSAMAGRLQREFPQSPEARIVREDKAVNAAPAALWFLAGNDLSIIAESRPIREETAVQKTVPGGPVMLQIGLFGREENAQTLAGRLRNAGFTPTISKKISNGKDHWVVGVAPGQDPSRTMQLLKDKGFESFPVF